MNKLTEWLVNPYLEEDINIPVKGYKLYKYNWEQTGKLMIKNKHWGPWDLKPPR